MAEEKVERLQGSVNNATDLNRSFNPAANLVQTVSQPQSVSTGSGSGSGSGTTANVSSSTGSSGSEGLSEQ